MTELPKTENQDNQVSLVSMILYFCSLVLGFFIIGGSILAVINSRDLKIKASINPAIQVSLGEINFSDIVSGQNNSREIEIRLSDLFNETEPVKSVRYLIHKFNQAKNAQDRIFCQKKANFPDVTNWQNYSAEDWQDFINSVYLAKCDLSLCPFISIKKVLNESSENGIIFSSRPQIIQNDAGFLDALTEHNVQNQNPAELLTEIRKNDKNDYGVDNFNYPKIIDGAFEFIKAKGYLEKNADISDKWILTLEAPCFKNDSTCNARFKEFFDRIPNELAGQNWGCAIWYEIINIERQ